MSKVNLIRKLKEENQYLKEMYNFVSEQVEELKMEKDEYERRLEELRNNPAAKHGLPPEPPLVLECIICGEQLFKLEDIRGNGGICQVLTPSRWPPNLYCEPCNNKKVGLFGTIANFFKFRKLVNKGAFIDGGGIHD